MDSPSPSASLQSLPVEVILHRLLPYLAARDSVVASLDRWSADSAEWRGQLTSLCMDELLGFDVALLDDSWRLDDNVRDNALVIFIIFGAKSEVPFSVYRRPPAKSTTACSTHI